MLDISWNKLTRLPYELLLLRNLEELYLRNNQLSELPSEIDSLSSLKLLDISLNELEVIPDSVGSLGNLIKLTLSENRLSILPRTIQRLSHLISIELNDNHFSYLPKQVTQLFTLKSLDLRGNKIRRFSPELSKLVNLKYLDLSSNRIDELPLKSNFPPNLDNLFLWDNPIPIPDEILKKSHKPKEIINFCHQLKTGKRELREGRLIVVGQRGVGKSSLACCLSKSDSIHSKSDSDAVEINTCILSVSTQKNIDLKVWDFGSNSFMNSTYRLFMSHRSLYLLVTDNCEDEENNRLAYWLNIIHAFDDKAPIIVIGNKVDCSPLELNRKSLIQKYPNIKGFIETSCIDGVGIEELRELIRAELSALHHFCELIPITWFLVKKELENIDCDYLSYKEYQTICQQKSIPKPHQQKELLDFLSGLGTVFYTDISPLLDGLIILNSDWITSGIHNIMNYLPLIVESRGVLDTSMLPDILNSHHYPPDKRIFLIELMERYELCFRVDSDPNNSQYLIPSIITEEEPDTSKWSESLAFQYEYSVLPESLISRFIVRTSHLISKQTYWRTGVVLARYGNRARVRSHNSTKLISVEIDGPLHSRRELSHLRQSRRLSRLSPQGAVLS